MELSLIKNAGFNDGEKHWTFHKAADKSIELLNAKLLPYSKQKYYTTSFPEFTEYFDGQKWVSLPGKFVVTARNDKKTNLILNCINFPIIKSEKADRGT